ncbi:hypothetical protein [Deinococcus sp. Leaf326]|uniref:hypothetical protein n=1 Tax=Deinococcus sp. Leaf326 TaxID=1736338 RepID=UPI0006F26250|nr:hypothetical protein [Deinococcus sp. Leaf326]KQR33121.1 hypothetical protein ASF71_16655 [Deinococcus sp. Leaf326]
MNVAELRARVEAALTGVQLGEYRFPGGQTAPALYVGDPPKGTTASGLEVLIYPTPKPRIISTFGGGINLKSWQVRIVNHDDGDLDGAMDAMGDAFDNMPTPQLIPEAGDIAEQMLFSIPDDPE